MKYEPYSCQKNLHELFEERVMCAKDAPAVKYDGKKYSYEWLNKRANQIAHYMLKRGVSVNDRIAVIVERGVDMVASILAVLKCGGTYVPIAPNYPEARKSYMIENSEAAFIITDRELIKSKIPCFQLTQVKEEKESNCGIRREKEALAYIIYTSGSSGKPKGVMIAQHAVVNVVEWVNKTFGVNEHTHTLCVTSMCFDLSVYDFFGTLSAGGMLVIASQKQIEEAAQLRKLVLKEKITFWNSVPTTMSSLMNACQVNPSEILESLETIFLSGDWIPLSLVDKMKEYCPNAEMVSLGGATEATVWSIYYCIKEKKEEWNSIPYGKAFQNNVFYILDENQNPVAKGKTGELYIGGLGVAKGYVNNKEGTKYAFLPDPFRNPKKDKMYRTGDLGRVMEDGNIEFLGRIDDQVKIRGFRIELKEIERQVKWYQEVIDAVVTARKKEQGENYICVYLICGKQFVLEKLKEHLAVMLPSYMIPSVYVKVDAIPLNGNGKVDKKRLPEPNRSNILTEIEFVKAKTEMEKKLEGVWKKVLSFDSIGIHSDFFEIGGTSLDCVVLEHEMKQAGIMLNYKEIMQYTTIYKQMQYLSSVKENNRDERMKKDRLNNGVNPFNDLYYINCFYNSLFPVLEQYQLDWNYVFLNYQFFYQIKKREGVGLGNVLSSKVWEKDSIEKVLKQCGVQAAYFRRLSEEKLKMQLEDTVNKGDYLILWIDSYFEPKRRDTYQKEHFAHTLLIYGKTEQGYLVLEHSHKDAMNYKEQEISFDILKSAYAGYQTYLLCETDRYTAIRFMGMKQKEPGNQDFAAIFRQNYVLCKEEWEQSQKAFRQYIEEYEPIEENLEIEIQEENQILDFKRAQLYVLKRVMSENDVRISLYEQIIEAFETVRNGNIRYKKGLLTEEEWKANKRVLPHIYELEQQVIKVMEEMYGK